MSPSPNLKPDGDLHQLTGQVIDDRLRVINLHHSGPRQWLYQVEPPSVGKTRRALKVIGDPLAREPGAFYRLKTAYQRLKRLESPYVEKVYECGLLHDLTPYVVTEWSPNESLYERLRMQRRPFSWPEVKGMLQGICRGLISMHEQGLAHGDLRAQHVLLRNTLDTPIMIDACINSALGSSPPPGLDKSWAYWAPERHGLSSATITSDMYSFGVLIYTCLQGHPPFSPHHDPSYSHLIAEGTQLSPVMWVERAHSTQAPQPLSDETPVMIKQLVDALLAKSPRQRPTAEEAMTYLEGKAGLDPLIADTLEREEHNSSPNLPSLPPTYVFDGERDSLTLPALGQSVQESNSTNISLSHVEMLALIAFTALAALGGLVLALL